VFNKPNASFVKKEQLFYWKILRANKPLHWKNLLQKIENLYFLLECLEYSLTSLFPLPNAGLAEEFPEEFQVKLFKDHNK